MRIAERQLKIVVNKIVVCSLIAVLALTPLGATAVADGPATGWLTPGNPTIKLAEVPADAASTVASNTDCYLANYQMVTREDMAISTFPFHQTVLKHTAACAVQTPSGIQDGVYLEAGVPAGKFAGHSGQVVRIPNSNRLLTWYTFITSIALKFTWYNAIVPTYNEVTGEVTYNLTGSAPFANQAGTPIYIRPNAYGFSSNGQWMVADSSVGFIRVSLDTREILPFAPGFIYGQGQNPGTVVAVSDDGQYAVRANISQQTVSFRVYDLSTCDTPPAVITGPVNCAYKDVQPSLQQTISDYYGSYSVRFGSPELLIFTAASKDSAGNVKHYSTRMAPSGHTIEGVKYLALGDSFSSGEGEMDDSYYLTGTNDTSPKNQCHVSIRSYPYLAAEALGLTSNFESVACSGARYDPHYFRQPQYGSNGKSSNQWLPGVKTQQQYLKSAIGTDVVTISMIGNDIQFSDKIKRCLMPDSCFTLLNERKSIAEEINGKFKNLVALYSDIKATSGGAKVYVLGYPQLFKPTPGCNKFNVGLDLEESITANKLTSYLDATIKAAAANAGVVYIDVEHAFVGKQLCDKGTGIAVNGVSKKGTESYHPNGEGHKLLAQQLLAQSHNFELEMPAPDTSAHALTQDSVAYSNFMQGASPGGIFARATYKDMVSDTLYWGVENAIKNIDVVLRPTSSYSKWMNSDPQYLGELTTDEAGELSGSITIPPGTEPGYHTLHIYGKDLANKDVDLYKTVYVAASESDYDGDGIPNEDEQCLIVEPVNVDYDRDGIDDACDTEIGEPPADSTPPEVAGVPDREPNANGWYNSDVTINWSAVDPEPTSGAPTQPVPTVASQEGSHSYISEPSCDPLNNCASGSLTLKIDKTAPDITYTLSPEPSASGWNRSAVTVTFACSDTMSGVAGCSEPEVVANSDGTYVVTGYTTDNAGNTNSVNALVSLDSTAPTVTKSLSSAANSFGWHNSDVTVTSLCSDYLSGVLTCSPSITLSGEGAHQIIESVATDGAGNTARESTSINIDKTAPVLSAATWDNRSKSVLGTAKMTVPATDNLSGIAEAEYYLGDTDPGQGNGATMQMSDNTISVSFNNDFPTGVYKVTARAKDRAGNWSTTVSDYLVVYDPFGTRMTGRRTLIPSLLSGDALPGLTTSDQDDKAKFGFNIRYDKNGQIHKNSDFQFVYRIGTKCGNPKKSQNCHEFELNATSIAWLVTQGQNSSTGIFQGTATLQIDGVLSNVVFRVVGLDGELLDATSEDHLTLKVYSENADPNTAAPIYQVSTDVLRGNIKIQKW